ncbi:MAG TPA: hypothetical protein VGR08_05595 [Thermomicrobiales bacterium]|nr:hypothetical protein [Thermomicrobiales bacterium]
MRRLLVSLGVIALTFTLTTPLAAKVVEDLGPIVDPGPIGNQPVVIPGGQFVPGGACSALGEFIPGDQFIPVDQFAPGHFTPGDQFIPGDQFSPGGECFSLPAVQNEQANQVIAIIGVLEPADQP